MEKGGGNSAGGLGKELKAIKRGRARGGVKTKKKRGKSRGEIALFGGSEVQEQKEFYGPALPPGAVEAK